MNSRFFAALIASYALFLLLPLSCQIMGLNLFINGATLMFFMIIPMILAAIISGILVVNPKSSLASPIIGGLAALITAHIFFGYLPDPFSSVFVYYSIQYFISIFASGAIASIFSYLRKPRERGEAVVEVREKETEKTIECPYCRREIPADSIFCPLCGSKIKEEVET